MTREAHYGLDRPVVIVSHGEETWRMLVPGCGEPELYLIELDHDADIAYQVEQYGVWADALAAIHDRLSPEQLALWLSDVNIERDRLRQYIADLDATLDELDVPEGWDDQCYGIHNFVDDRCTECQQERVDAA